MFGSLVVVTAGAAVAGVGSGSAEVCGPITVDKLRDTLDKPDMSWTNLLQAFACCSGVGGGAWCLGAECACGGVDGAGSGAGKHL